MNAAPAFALDGEVALVTGGGSGLGLAMARCLVASGARAVLAGRRAAAVREAAEALGPAASWVAHDVTRLEAAGELVAAAEERAGPVSILINNAGVHLKKDAVETTPEEFHAVLATHVEAAFALTRAALPGMYARGHGSVLFTASMASYLGLPRVVAYSAAKAAYLGMVRSLAAECAPRGVRVNGIAPGWIETPMLRRALDGDAERERRILGRTPLGRFGEPDDVGWAAVYLCSPAARFVTGTVLPVDGGAVIGL